MSRVRRVVLGQGDSLRDIAARELNDPTRWSELARINDLRLPFIVASWRSEDRLPHTLIWGDRLLIPWTSNNNLSPSPRSLFGQDILLDKGRLSVDGGDIGTVSGADNVVQAIRNRLKCLRGEVNYHPAYGSHVSLALGLPAGPFASLMASAWTHEALREESRIAAIDGVGADVNGDTIRVGVRATLVGDNTAIDTNLVLNP